MLSSGLMHSPFVTLLIWINLYNFKEFHLCISLSLLQNIKISTFCHKTLKYVTFCREMLKYGTFCRECRKNLNIRAMRKWFWIKSGCEEAPQVVPAWLCVEILEQKQGVDGKNCSYKYSSVSARVVSGSWMAKVQAHCARQPSQHLQLLHTETSACMQASLHSCLVASEG